MVDDTNRRADAELADWIIREFGRSWYEVRGRRKSWRMITPRDLEVSGDLEVGEGTGWT